MVDLRLRTNAFPGMKVRVAGTIRGTWMNGYVVTTDPVKGIKIRYDQPAGTKTTKWFHRQDPKWSPVDGI